MMDRARFERLSEIVQDALERDASELGTFLVEACAGDEALLREAEALLSEGAERRADAMEQRIDAGMGAAAAGVTSARVSLPERIGPHEVTGLLGEGGMGVVYRARQSEPLERDVAIKVIRAGLRTRTGLARFEAERRTLAHLQHPNIAQLFDAGTTQDGSPYFVMELVHGEPITTYCDRAGLAVDARLRLFLRTLDAVGHAHQRSITHRDLKPSNVLVTEIDGRPTPKVIDFGVARVAEGEDHAAVSPATRTGMPVGTLEYMSPEQAFRREGDVDTRSDIYSLGILLYQVLTGLLPWEVDELRSAGPVELAELLESGHRRLASRRSVTTAGAGERAKERATHVDGLHEALRGDLDNIIAKAIDPDRERRYPTVYDFADDLRRQLSGHPVSAVPATLSYRTRRFVARHRAAVAGTALAAATLLAVVTGFTLRLADERDRAQLEAEKSEEVSRFLQNIFAEADPFGVSQGEVTARELLDAGRSRIEGRLDDQPELRAELLSVAGQSYSRLGLYDDAAELLEEAVETARTVGGQAELGRLLMLLGNTLGETEDIERAEEVLRESVQLRESALGARHPETAQSMAWLGGVVRGQGGYDEAETLLAEAVQILRETRASPDEDLAMALHIYGFALRSLSRFAEAEEIYREALAMRLELHPRSHPHVQSTMGNLASVLDERGLIQEATDLMAEALELREAQLGPDHPLLLGSVNNLAFMYMRMGDYQDGAELFQRGVSTGRTAFGGDHRVQGILLMNLGTAQRRAGDLSASRATLEECLAMFRRLFGDEHTRVADALNHLGRLSLLEGRPEAAIPLHRDALDITTRLLGADHLDRATGLAGLGRALSEVGQIDDALPLLDEAVALTVEHLEPTDARTAAAYHERGLVREAAGQRDAARQDFEEALTSRRAGLPDRHPDLVESLLALGRRDAADGSADAARARLEEALEIARSRLGETSRTTLEIERELASLGN